MIVNVCTNSYSSVTLILLARIVSGASISLSVTRLHTSSICKHGWTDRGPAWVGDSWNLKNIVLNERFDCLHWFDTAFAKLHWSLIHLRRTPVLTIAPPGHRVRVDFSGDFDIEKSDDCSYDYIELRDGLYGFSTLLGRYCGQRPSGTVKSSGRAMWIAFKTDDSVEYAGFQAAFYFFDGKLLLCANNLSPCQTVNGLTFWLSNELFTVCRSCLKCVCVCTCPSVNQGVGNHNSWTLHAET